MRVESDLDKKVTFGDADGPDLFVDQLGIVVPTFIDPRNDLIPGNARAYKRVSHHIPFGMRGFFTLDDWPEDYRTKVSNQVDDDGFVLCAGFNKAKNKCASKAVNRTQFCRNHGGGLHPLDKKISNQNVVAPPEDRVRALDRPQKFMQGFLSAEDLTDEEIQGMFIFSDDGRKVSSISLGIKIHQQITQELHKRLNRFLQTKTASMLSVMVDIAESELVEPADRIKAAQWVAERTLGKTPDIIIHGKTEQPYEAIFDSIDAGSRENYRTQITSTRLDLGGETEPYLDAEVVGEPEDSDSGEDELQGQGSELRGDEQGTDLHANLERARQLSADRDDVDRQKELKKARAKAKQRRYAARANGSTTTLDLPWLIEWKFVEKGADAGCFKMQVVCPDDQTQARIDKVTKSNVLALEKAEAFRRNNVA